jgi:hypothetical protein
MVSLTTTVVRRYNLLWSCSRPSDHTAAPPVLEPPRAASATLLNMSSALSGPPRSRGGPKSPLLPSFSNDAFPVATGVHSGMLGGHCNHGLMGQNIVTQKREGPLLQPRGQLIRLIYRPLPGTCRDVLYTEHEFACGRLQTRRCW